MLSSRIRWFLVREHRDSTMRHGDRGCVRRNINGGETDQTLDQLKGWTASDVGRVSAYDAPFGEHVSYWLIAYLPGQREPIEVCEIRFP